MIQISTDQSKEIISLPFLSSTDYSNLDVEKTLEYMVKRYINPLKEKIDIAKSSFVDCGSGFGWLAFAYLLSGGKSATLCEIDSIRLKEAKNIAGILGLEKKCTFIDSAMQDLKFYENEFDIFASVETLEHVGENNIDKCLNVMARATNSIIILTTPNKFFPLVIHDNKIPFSHWVPSQFRNRYTSLFGLNEKHPNDFVSPLRLKIFKNKFRPSSVTLTFASYRDWKSSYPFCSPYNSGNRWKEKPPLVLKLLYWTLSIAFGRHCHLFAPNLCRMWIRK